MGQVYEWIKDFFKQPSAKINYKWLKIRLEKCNYWYPQGSVLGSALFLVFINDFPDVIEVLLKLFADDTKVYNIISNLNGVQPLQRSVNNAGTWSI